MKGEPLTTKEKDAICERLAKPKETEMKAEFVRWECGCEGIHLPENNEDVIVNPCREKGRLRFSLSDKCKGTSHEALPIDDVVDLADDMDVLSNDGHSLRLIKLLMGGEQ